MLVYDLLQPCGTWPRCAADKKDLPRRYVPQLFINLKPGGHASLGSHS